MLRFEIKTPSRAVVPHYLYITYAVRYTIGILTKCKKINK